MIVDVDIETASWGLMGAISCGFYTHKFKAELWHSASVAEF